MLFMRILGLANRGKFAEKNIAHQKNAQSIDFENSIFGVQDVSPSSRSMTELSEDLSMGSNSRLRPLSSSRK